MNRNDTLLRKYVKGYGFFSFARNLSKNIEKKLLDSATKTGLDDARTASKKVFQKTAEAAEQTGYKIADKQMFLPNENSRYVEVTVIPPEKRQEILSALRQLL